MTDAPKAAIAGGDLRFQYTRDGVAEPQIGMTDDTRAQPALAVTPTRAHRRRAVDRFNFADWLQLGGAIDAVHRTALDKDAVRDVVAAAGIGEQLVEQVSMLVTVPEMVVRIDNLERRL